MKYFNRFALLLMFTALSAVAAVDVPTDIQQPGTQPGEAGGLESPKRCDNCHGGYDQSVEMAHNWRGSMMAQAGRDPIFWATVAVAEQDFDGSGDLCLRCHSTTGWLEGRSTPTDGSGLAASDSNGRPRGNCRRMGRYFLIKNFKLHSVRHPHPIAHHLCCLWMWLLCVVLVTRLLSSVGPGCLSSA